MKVPPIPPAQLTIERDGVEKTVTVYALDGRLREIDCIEELTAQEQDYAREALVAALDADPATRAYRGWLED